jgi:hypothetical protein
LRVEFRLCHCYLGLVSGSCHSPVRRCSCHSPVRRCSCHSSVRRCSCHSPVRRCSCHSPGRQVPHIWQSLSYWLLFSFCCVNFKFFRVKFRLCHCYLGLVSGF